MLIGKTLIDTSMENITKAAFVDAIVNSSNSQLYGQHGVNGAIHNAAGKELRLACEKLGGCKPGEAKITDAYALPCKYILHTVGPIWQDGEHDEETILKSCYVNVLNLAMACNIRSIGFPSISTGRHGFPVNKAALIAIKTVSGFVQDHPGVFDKVIWFLHKSETKQIYDEALSTMESVNTIKPAAEIPETPVHRIGFDNNVILLPVHKCVYDSHNVILVRGILSILNPDGSQTVHMIPARFCPQCKTFYTSVTILENLKKEGIPLCKVISGTVPLNNNEGTKSLEKIQNILIQHGYHMKNLEKLTPVQRRIILAMLIERNIITANDLIKYLDSLIQNGKNKPFYHQSVKNLGKWKSDKDFVFMYGMK